MTQNPYESPETQDKIDPSTGRGENHRREIERSLAVAASMLLAGLWAGAPYQPAAFLLAVSIGTLGLLVGTIVYALVVNRRGVVVFLPLFLAAVVGRELFSAFFLLLGMIGFPIALLLTLLRPARQRWILTGQTVLAAVMALCSIFLYGHLQTLGATHAANRGERIVDAINRYEELEGKLPTTLEELVPQQLESIPETGMVGFPSFDYRGPMDAATEAEKRLFTKYELRVNLYKLLQFDCLVYWPEANYPDAMYGGGVQRIDDWAYVHE